MKVIRIIAHAPTLDHCRPLFVQLKIPTVINIYIFDLVSYILKNSHLINSKPHNYNTRNKFEASIQFHRLSKTVNSHIVISLKIYNKIIHLILKYPISAFKTKFYNWLLDNPFYSLDEFFLYYIIIHLISC